MDRPVIPEQWLDRLEQRVAETEHDCEAEVVVVFAARSGSYRDLSLLFGVGIAAVTLLVLLYVPLSFPALTVLPLTLAVGGAGAVLASRSPGLLRRLALPERRQAQVETRAREVFYDEAVSATRERTGLLIFVSMLEHRVEVLTDHGLDSRIPRGTWNTILADATRDRGWPDAGGLVEDLLARARPLLAEHFPATDDNPDEIPNRPRVLS